MNHLLAGMYTQYNHPWSQLRGGSGVCSVLADGCDRRQPDWLWKAPGFTFGLLPSTFGLVIFIHYIKTHDFFWHCLGVHAWLRSAGLNETGPRAEYGNLSSSSLRGGIDKLRERWNPCLPYTTFLQLFQYIWQPLLKDVFILSKSWKNHTHSQPAFMYSR